MALPHRSITPTSCRRPSIPRNFESEAVDGKAHTAIPFEEKRDANPDRKRRAAGPLARRYVRQGSTPVSMEYALELRVLPPIVAAITALVMWLAARAWPQAGLVIRGREGVAAALAVAGSGAVAIAILGIRRSRTTVTTLNLAAASSLVSTGILRVSRNAMYLGFAILTAWGLYRPHAFALVGIAAFVSCITRFQIIPEDRALHSLVGTDVDWYTSRVRRWI